MDKIKLSPSSINMILRCPHSYYLYKKFGSDFSIKNEKMSLGNAFHKIIQAYLIDDGNNKALDKAIEEINYNEFDPQELIDLLKVYKDQLNEIKKSIVAIESMLSLKSVIRLYCTDILIFLLRMQ